LKLRPETESRKRKMIDLSTVRDPAVDNRIRTMDSHGFALRSFGQIRHDHAAGAGDAGLAVNALVVWLRGLGDGRRDLGSGGLGLVVRSDLPAAAQEPVPSTLP
jgi:hypothetical protein